MDRKNTDGPIHPKAQRVEVMILIDQTEAQEIRLALRARARATGSGTEHHKVCQSVLKKLDDASEKPARDGVENSRTPRKVAGPDTSEFSDI